MGYAVFSLSGREYFENPLKCFKSSIRRFLKWNNLTLLSAHMYTEGQSLLEFAESALKRLGKDIDEFGLCNLIERLFWIVSVQVLFLVDQFNLILNSPLPRNCDLLTDSMKIVSMKIVSQQRGTLIAEYTASYNFTQQMLQNSHSAVNSVKPMAMSHFSAFVQIMIGSQTLPLWEHICHVRALLWDSSRTYDVLEGLERLWRLAYFCSSPKSFYSKS